jgi:hypothetical protein
MPRRLLRDEGKHRRRREHDRHHRQSAAERPARVVHHGDEDRARYAGRAPRGEERPVVRPHVPGAEVVGVERRHGSKAAAVAKQDHRERGDRPDQAVRAAHQEENHRLHQENERERVRAPDPVGDSSPKKAAERIEQRDPSVGRGDSGRRSAGELLKDGQRVAAVTLRNNIDQRK